MNRTIVVIDDEPSALDFARTVLDSPSREIHTYEDPVEAVAKLARHRADIVICDFRMPKMNGLEVLRRCRSIAPDARFVMLTGMIVVEESVTAMKEGASDVIMKPYSIHDLRNRIDKLLELRDAAVNSRQSRLAFENGSAPGSMEHCLELARSVAPSKAPVLITGATGVGKEVFADFIQRNSGRGDKPYIKINCSALPSNLIESELFGHEKGAFTGAFNTHIGRFERANGGTLFLDEIGEMPLPIQVKLLRVLQTHEIERVGSDRSIHADFKLICATHRDLPAMVKAGTFREDLFYRINVFPIDIPLLRERPREIVPLSAQFLARALNASAEQITISPEAAALLHAYSWNGNVRELENAIERASFTVCDACLLPKDIWWLNPSCNEESIRNAYDIHDPCARTLKTPQAQAPAPPDNPLEASERRTLLEILEKFHWNFTQAARALQISRSTLYMKAQHHKITRSA